MNKRISLKGSLVAAIAILGGVAVVPACSSSDHPETSQNDSTKGSIGLSLVTNGVAMDTVEFSITGPEARTGTINVDSDDSTISAFIGALLAGPGYVITLTAFNDGVEVCSGTSAAFTVTAGATVGVGVGLNCGAAGNPRGNITVNGEVVSCPQITSVFVGPLQTGLNEEIDVSAAASAAGATFLWTSTGGSFTPTPATATSYICSTPGPNTVTVTMTFGTCDPESISTQVVCVDGGGGTGGATGGSTGGTTGGTTGDPCADCMTGQLDTNANIAQYQIDLCDPDANCLAVENCAIDSGCILSSPANCFCGANTDDCDAPGFVPVGECAAEIRTAIGPGPSNAEIFTTMLTDFANPASIGLILSGEASVACVQQGTCSAP